MVYSEGGGDISACHRAAHTSPALLSHKRGSPGDVKLLQAEQRFKRINVTRECKYKSPGGPDHHFSLFDFGVQRSNTK